MIIKTCNYEKQSSIHIGYMTEAGVWQMQPVFPPRLFVSPPVTPYLYLHYTPLLPSKPVGVAGELQVAPSLVYGANCIVNSTQCNLLFNNGKVLSQKETSSCGVLSPGKASPGSAIWRPASHLCPGPTTWLWLHGLQLEIRSSECSACVSGPLKFPEHTHPLCVPHSTGCLHARQTLVPEPTQLWIREAVAMLYYSGGGSTKINLFQNNVCLPLRNHPQISTCYHFGRFLSFKYL